MKTDDKGRIMNLMKIDQIHSGHSVCNTCGKDMPTCWDTVCHICGDTSCYDCSYIISEYWYCEKHIYGVKLWLRKFKKFVLNARNAASGLRLQSTSMINRQKTDL